MIKTKKNKGIEIDLTGPQGNVFFLIGTAGNLAKQLGLDAAAIKKEIDKVRAVNKDGVLGVNLMHAMNDYGEYATFLATQDIDFIVSGAGLPVDLPSFLVGSKVKGAFIISSEGSSSIIVIFAVVVKICGVGSLSTGR